MENLKKISILKTDSRYKDEWQLHFGSIRKSSDMIGIRLFSNWSEVLRIEFEIPSKCKYIV